MQSKFLKPEHLAGLGFAFLGLFLGLSIGLSGSPVLGATLTAGFALAASLVTAYFSKGNDAEVGAAARREGENQARAMNARPGIPIKIESSLTPFAMLLVVGLLVGIALRANDFLNYQPSLKQRFVKLGFNDLQVNQIMDGFAYAESKEALTAKKSVDETSEAKNPPPATEKPMADKQPTTAATSPLMTVLMQNPTALPAPQAPAAYTPGPSRNPVVVYVPQPLDFWQRMDLLGEGKDPEKILAMIEQQVPLVVLRELLRLKKLDINLEIQDIIFIIKEKYPNLMDTRKAHVYNWRDFWKRMVYLEKDKNPAETLRIFKEHAPLTEVEMIHGLRKKIPSMSDEQTIKLLDWIYSTAPDDEDFSSPET